jgi:hypothetical protein
MLQSMNERRLELEAERFVGGKMKTASNVTLAKMHLLWLMLLPLSHTTDIYPTAEISPTRSPA